MADIEPTRAVVEAGETFDGKIIPSEQTDLGRPVRINQGATVDGSIYGETVEIGVDATVAGSVMASEAVELAGGEVQGEVGTPGKVVAEGARISGTVTGTRVRLTDCVVRGNVVGADVVLEDCVVLGIATADRTLELEESLCYTARAPDQLIADGATLVLPLAIVGDSVELETPVAVAGLGERDRSDGGGADGSDVELPRMTRADLHQDGEDRYLTLAPRVLDLEAVSDRLAELERGIVAAVDDTSDDEVGVEDVLSLLGVDVPDDTGG